MKHPLVSIAMTSYNGSKFIEKQLNSLCNQTYKNFEVVICDDCSTDETVQIISKFKEKLKINLIENQKNLGMVKNFEKSISLCKGEFIALCDWDDIWLPQKIEILVSKIENYSLVFSDAALIDSNDNVIQNSFRKYSKIKTISGKPLLHLFFANYVTGCMTLFTRELAQKSIPIPDGERFHDWWIATVATKVHGIKAIDDKLILYRQHSSNEVGAKKAYNLFTRIVSLIKNPLIPYYDIRNYEKRFSKIQIKRIKAIKKSPIFTPKEQRILREVYSYYVDVYKSNIHWTRAKLAYKYRNVIFDYNKGISRFLTILSRLII